LSSPIRAIARDERSSFKSFAQGVGVLVAWEVLTIVAMVLLSRLGVM
jgi:hypothetical protein